MANDVSAAYRSGDRTYFPLHFADENDRRRAVRGAARPIEPAVASAIEEQNGRLAPSPRRDRHIALLRQGAAAVVTGQQVGLFLGPLYNLYKAASAIVLARQLTTDLGEPVVPVFWLQSEDHDLPEIAHCRVPRASGDPLCLELPASPADRISLAHVRLPAAVDEQLRCLHEELAGLRQATPHLERLSKHYRDGAGWVEAFAGMLAELFAPEGLVLINPRMPELAPVAAAIHRRAVDDAESIAGALMERGAALQEAGYTAAVHVRPGAPLSFFHPEGPQGPRFRLEPEGAGWCEVGGERVHDTAALRAALDSDPLSFSTSVLLRPILQDTLLPTAAYVGGAGEIAYFAQLEPLYAHFEMAMPLIVPRAAFRIIEDKTRRLLDRLGVDSTSARLSDEAVLASSAPHAIASGSDLRQRMTGSFAASLDQVLDQLTSAGPGMERAVEKARSSVEHCVDRLVAKYEKALLHRDEEALRALRQVKQFLHPGGTPQERYYGFPYFAARYGERPFVEQLLASVVPLDPEEREIQLVDPSC